ncbi:MAG: hypothetical protein GX077_05590 [Tissierellia bacterium]|nr:hypothetical protein [Tissierellia bacterium]
MSIGNNYLELTSNSVTTEVDKKLPIRNRNLHPGRQVPAPLVGIRYYL